MHKIVSQNANFTKNATLLYLEFLILPTGVCQKVDNFRLQNISLSLSHPLTVVFDVIHQIF
jgi:hypothetical protein